MNKIKTLAVLAVLLAFQLFLVSVVQASEGDAPPPATGTNSVPTIGPLKPILDLLPAGAAAFITKLVIWFGSFALILAPFSVKIQHKLTDMLNTAAASAETDDDIWLQKLFRNPVYRFFATLLRFVHLRLPTIADLERAIALQKEAVAAAKSNR